MHLDGREDVDADGAADERPVERARLHRLPQRPAVAELCVRMVGQSGERGSGL